MDNRSKNYLGNKESKCFPKLCNSLSPTYKGLLESFKMRKYKIIKTEGEQSQSERSSFIFEIL